MIGILGGSFNPIHNGHVEMAKTVLKECPEITEVWMMVAKQNPLKTEKPVNFKDRFEMVRLACIGNPGIIPCDLELSYERSFSTLDLMLGIERDFPGFKFCLIIGMDNYLTFHHWYGYGCVAEHWPLYVLTRPGYVKNENPDFPVGKFIESSEIPVSSSQIRYNLEEYKEYLPEKVYRYIIEHELYGPSEKS